MTGLHCATASGSRISTILFFLCYALLAFLCALGLVLIRLLNNCFLVRARARNSQGANIGDRGNGVEVRVIADKRQSTYYFIITSMNIYGF
jgi:hypothetical protein